MAPTVDKMIRLYTVIFVSHGYVSVCVVHKKWTLLELDPILFGFTKKTYLASLNFLQHEQSTDALVVVIQVFVLSIAPCSSKDGSF